MAVRLGFRFRHLMLDFAQLLPHCKRDPKLDTKKDREVINEAADLKVHINELLCPDSRQSGFGPPTHSADLMIFGYFYCQLSCNKDSMPLCWKAAQLQSVSC